MYFYRNDTLHLILVYQGDKPNKNIICFPPEPGVLKSYIGHKNVFVKTHFRLYFQRNIINVYLTLCQVESKIQKNCFWICFEGTNWWETKILFCLALCNTMSVIIQLVSTLMLPFQNSWCLCRCRHRQRSMPGQDTRLDPTWWLPRRQSHYSDPKLCTWTNKW